MLIHHVPKSVAVIFDNCLNKDPQKRALVDELGFGVFSNLPNCYLKQKVLKQIYNRFDTYDNTIHAVAGEVEITTETIGKVLGLNHTGSTYDDKITTKELRGEDYDAYKFFQGKTQAALSSLIFNTKVHTEENRILFKRAFLLYIQKCFHLLTSALNVTPRALPTIFDLENTRNKNWALHVHNFLLEEIEKAKKNSTKSVSGCCYSLMVIYFHETHFGKNSRDAAAQPPWIQYWMGETLWKKMKQEKTMAADGHTLAQAVSSIRKRKNLQIEERRQKRTKQQGEQHHHQPPQQPPKEEDPSHEQHHKQTPQQPHQPCQQQQPQKEYIDISSCSKGEPEPTPIKVLIPKAKTDILPTTEDMIKEAAPSQLVLEVVPIYPTQEVEDDLVTSPSSTLITEVLMSMGQDKGEEPQPDSPPDPSILSLEQRNNPPKTLEEEFPLTTRTMQVIEGMDEHVSGHEPPVETPNPLKLLRMIWRKGWPFGLRCQRGKTTLKRFSSSGGTRFWRH
ncbi:hypothetical protein PIB30_085627 [Stylosanthes scabra]|uniref:Uncharacterized protein n=1 Tax=Stylosanthes scabra TaxID=79078 RepID=A0ABU6WR79_9FABA|nr:hypothetical protein [Stylosanthes scabra]